MPMQSDSFHVHRPFYNSANDTVTCSECKQIWLPQDPPVACAAEAVHCRHCGEPGHEDCFISSRDCDECFETKENCTCESKEEWRKLGGRFMHADPETKKALEGLAKGSKEIDVVEELVGAEKGKRDYYTREEIDDCLAGNLESLMAYVDYKLEEAKQCPPPHNGGGCYRSAKVEKRLSEHFFTKHEEVKWREAVLDVLKEALDHVPQQRWFGQFALKNVSGVYDKMRSLRQKFLEDPS